MAMTPQHVIDQVVAFEIELADDERQHSATIRREHAKLAPANRRR